MLEITHYHSVDEILKSAPPIDAICHRCRNLNFVDLFAGPRYEDFDQGYEKPALDVFIATLAEIRKSADQCRICYIIVVFHDARHVGDQDCTAGASEDLEHCTLKPYRTDVLLHMNDRSEDSQKETIATSLAVAFSPASKEKSDGIRSGLKQSENGRGKRLFTWARDILLQSSRLFQEDLFFLSDNNQVGADASLSNLPLDPTAESGKSYSISEDEGEFCSGSDSPEERSAHPELPDQVYSIHNCFFSLTETCSISNRSALSLSDSTSGSTIDWRSLRHWVRACETGHLQCQQDQESLPMESGMRIRCIDVKTSQLVPVDFQTRYVALSYVWGAAHSEIAGYIIRSTIRDNSTIIPKNLPPTVRDAIKVTKQLRERYLWVDCVCIDQNDIDAVQEQVGIMDRIYESAVLTIITSTSDNIHDEIPGLRPASRLKSSIEVLIDGRAMKAMCAKSVIDEFYGAWQGRGWTYQEWILSRRCLFFSANQIMFRCQESSGLESFMPPKATVPHGNSLHPHFWADRRSSLTTLSRLPLGSASWSFQTYAELVRDYTCRNLTYDSDVLHAFTGIMRKLERSCTMTFIEGLPEKDILSALLWSSMDTLSQGTQHFRRPERPSWTWSAFGCHSGYLCWEVLEPASPAMASTPRYQDIIGSRAPTKSRAVAGQSSSDPASHVSIFLAISFDFSKENYPDLYKAIRYRRADVVILPETKQRRKRSLLISSETRKVLIHQNPQKSTPGDFVCLHRSKDDVLHPVTKKLLSGRHFGNVGNRWERFWLFYVNVGLGGEEKFQSFDAILLYEWDIAHDKWGWHQTVVAMIIDRSNDGTAERVSLTSIRSEDWYTLPLVSKREDVVLV